MRISKETWKWIRGYRGLYKISNYGRILSYHYAKDGRPISSNQYINGHSYVALSKDGKSSIFFVSRLVADAFIRNPNNLKYVYHKDGDLKNNMYNNLKWVASYDHMIQMVIKANKTYTKVKCVETGKIYTNYSDAARNLGISHSAVRYSVLHGTKTYIGCSFVKLESGVV